MEHFNLIIIGGGPAGMTSGIYSARSGLSTLIIEKMVTGGAMATAPLVENYPGYEKINGFELATLMRAHAIKSGVNIKELEQVERLDLKEKLKKIYTTNNVYTCDALIIATGGERRKLNVKGEDVFAGKGVSYCAVCDGALYRNKKVGVIGGSNCAASAALYLANLSCKVFLIHRRDSLRCESVLDRQIKDSQIEIIWDSIVEEIEGDQILKNIQLKNLKTNNISTLELDGLFIEIGIDPNSEIATKAGIEIDKKGYIIVDKKMQTNIPGIFAAGDVTNGVEQIAVAVGEGTVAYDSAYHFIHQGVYPKGSCELK